MTTVITLDRNALKMLIDSDPEFSVSLKGAVLGQIGLRYFEKDVRRIIAAAEPEMFAKALSALQQDEDARAILKKTLTEAVVQRTDSWTGTVSLTEKVKQMIADEVSRIRDKAVHDAIATVNADIADRVHKHLADLNSDDRIERRVSRLTDDYINGEVKRRFDQRLAELAKQ